MSAVVVVACRVVLSVVFGVAAWTKGMDYPHWRGSLDQHGFGAGASGLAAAFVPLAELGVALGLLTPAPPVAAHAAALAALALLITFTAVTARTLATGHAASCACFGRWSGLGPPILLRNALLAVPALLVAFTA